MKINIGEDNKIEIKMKGQFEEDIETFQQEIGAVIILPSTGNIITVDKNCEQLSDERSEILHYVTDKLLYITMRDMPYLEPTV